MFIGKVLLVVEDIPLCMNGPTTRYNASLSRYSHGDVTEEDTSVDSEVYKRYIVFERRMGTRFCLVRMQFRVQTLTVPSSVIANHGMTQNHSCKWLTINTLLSLLNERLPEHFPVQIFSDTINLGSEKERKPMSYKEFSNKMMDI